MSNPSYAYEHFLMTTLAMKYGIISNTTPYDLAYEKGIALYREFNRSIFDREDESEATCIVDFLKYSLLKSYCVEVQRESTQYTEIYIDARSEEEAKSKAGEMVTSQHFLDCTSFAVNYTYKVTEN